MREVEVAFEGRYRDHTGHGAARRHRRRDLASRSSRRVRAIEPTGMLRHPAATVTVADPEALAAALGR
jgi:hypothetical protein